MLPHSPLNKAALHPRNLLLELLDLLPAIQRPTIIHPQTTNQVLFRLLNTLIRLLDLFPLFEFRLQRFDLFAYAVAAASRVVA